MTNVSNPFSVLLLLPKRTPPAPFFIRPQERDIFGIISDPGLWILVPASRWLYRSCTKPQCPPARGLWPMSGCQDNLEEGFEFPILLLARRPRFAYGIRPNVADAISESDYSSNLWQEVLR